MCAEIAGHAVIYMAIAILAIMVLFLVFGGLVHFRRLSRIELRFEYLENQSDLIYQTQEHINKILVAYMEGNE